jgi:hypothetical protein
MGIFSGFWNVLIWVGGLVILFFTATGAAGFNLTDLLT